jgi:hypothetical protein
MTRQPVKAANDGRPFNNLLRRLNAPDYALIEPFLEQAAATADDLLYSPGDDVETCIFRVDQVSSRFSSRTKTAAMSKPFWSAGRAPSAASSARVFCRPIRGSP